MRNNDSKQQVLWLVLIISLVALMFAPLRASGQTLAEAAEAVDECVQKADVKRLVAPTAEIVKLDKAFVEKALVENGCKVSELVYVQAIASKTGRTPAAVLEAYAGQDWTAAIKKEGISPATMLEKLDDAYADFALKMMSFPGKKKDTKRTVTAKR
jgi:hypothetical protein